MFFDVGMSSGTQARKFPRPALLLKRKILVGYTVVLRAHDDHVFLVLWYVKPSAPRHTEGGDTC